jgi:hypothetical protein
LPRNHPPKQRTNPSDAEGQLPGKFTINYRMSHQYLPKARCPEGGSNGQFNIQSKGISQMTNLKNPLGTKVYLQIKEYGVRQPIDFEGPMGLVEAVQELVGHLRKNHFRESLTITISKKPIETKAKHDEERLKRDNLLETAEDQDQPKRQFANDIDSSDIIGDNHKLRNECFRKLRMDYPAGRLTTEEHLHWISVAEEHGWQDLIV